MNSHGNFTKTGIDFPLKSHQNLLITNEHLIMTRKLTLQHFNRQHGGQWMNLLVVPVEKRNSIDYKIDKIVG